MNEITPAIYDDLELLPPDFGGWLHNKEVFVKLISQKRPAHIVEVGTWKGASAIHMANIIKDLNMECRITCVDTWLGAVEFWDRHKDDPPWDLKQKNGYPQVYRQFLSNVVHAGHQDIILPMPMPSSMAAEILRRRGACPDMIYVDGSHEFRDVIRDMTDYGNLLREGGVLFGDDFTAAWPGVKAAVLDFSRDSAYWKLEIDGNIWICRRLIS